MKDIYGLTEAEAEVLGPRPAAQGLGERTGPRPPSRPVARPTPRVYRSISSRKFEGKGVPSPDSAFSTANSAIFSTAHGKCASLKLR
jgi:hypothetical protein